MSRAPARGARFRSRRGLSVAGAVVVALPLLAGSTHADDGSAANQDLARSVAITGREAFNAGDYETAAALFRRAYTLFPAPTVVLYEARALERLGRWIEALDAYERTSRMPLDPSSPEQFVEAVEAARAEGQELRANIPMLTVQVTGVSANDPNLRLEINGRAIGAAQLGQALSLNPGTYRISGSVDAERHDESNAVLEKGTRVTIVLDLAPPILEAPPPFEPPPSETSTGTHIPTFAIVAGGVGIAGIAGGVVTGLISSSKHSEAERKCPDHLCVRGSEGAEAAAAFRSWRTVSTVSYGIGLAGVAAGVLLWWVDDPTPETEQVALEPWFGPSGGGVRGTF